MHVHAQGLCMYMHNPTCTFHHYPFKAARIQNTMKNKSLTLCIFKLMKMTNIKSKKNDGHQQNDRYNCLRPFVIPTFTSDTRSTKPNEHAGWLFDVTPCLAKYIKVTIMEHPQDCPSPGSTDDKSTL